MLNLNILFSISLDRFARDLTARVFRKYLNRNQEGFTLVELIVVIVILLILGSISIPSFLNIIEKVEAQAAQLNLMNAFDHVLSFLTFLISKTLYFCGLRPSYSDIPTHILLLRSFVGIFLLPGLIYIFLSDKRDLKILIFLYILPIFIGAIRAVFEPMKTPSCILVLFFFFPS